MPNRNTHLASLVGQIFLDAGSGEDDDADRHDVQHLIVAFEWRGLCVLAPVWTEGDLRHFASIGPAGRDLFGALGRTAMQQNHARMFGMDLIELRPDLRVIGAVAT